MRAKETLKRVGLGIAGGIATGALLISNERSSPVETPEQPKVEDVGSIINPCNLLQKRYPDKTPAISKSGDGYTCTFKVDLTKDLPQAPLNTRTFAPPTEIVSPSDCRPEDRINTDFFIYLNGETTQIDCVSDIDNLFPTPTPTPVGYISPTPDPCAPRIQWAKENETPGETTSPNTECGELVVYSMKLEDISLDDPILDHVIFKPVPLPTPKIENNPQQNQEDTDNATLLLLLGGSSLLLAGGGWGFSRTKKEDN